MSRLGSSAAHRLLQTLKQTVVLNRSLMQQTVALNQSQVQQSVVLNRSPTEPLGRLLDLRHWQGYLREALPTSLPYQRLTTSSIPGNQPLSLVSQRKQCHCHSFPYPWTAGYHPLWHLKSVPPQRYVFQSISQLTYRLTARLDLLGLQRPVGRSLWGLAQAKQGLSKRRVQRRSPSLIAPTVLSTVLLLKSTTALASGGNKYSPHATSFLVLPQSHALGATPWSEQDPNTLGIKTDATVDMVVHADQVRRWWVRRLLLPALAVALVCVAWSHGGPIKGLSVLVSILLLTRPSLQSLEMHLEEQRMLLELEDGGIIDRVQRHLLRLAQVEFHDCHLFAFARLHSISQTKTMVGVLGQWWELQTVSWSIFTGSASQVNGY